MRKTILATAASLLVLMGVAGSSGASATGSVPYDGSVALALGYTGTPFASYWNQPLPDNTPVNVNNGAYISKILANLSPQLSGYHYGALNTSEWSAPLYVVPASQPMVPVGVYCSDGSAPNGKPNLANNVLAGGIPIPADAHAAAGTDESISIYQPATNRLWEMWRLQKDSGGNWVVCWAGRIDNVSQSSGWFPAPYGSSASGSTHLGGIPRIEELQAGHIDHVMNLTLPDTAGGPQTILNKNVAPANTPGATNGISWPANRTDGKSYDPLSVPEGLRFRLPADLNLNQYNLTPVARMIAVAAQKYGFVVIDGGGGVSIRLGDPTTYTAAGYANPYVQLFGADYTKPYLVMENFPWDKLQALPFNYGINGMYTVASVGGSSPGTANVTATSSNGGTVTASGTVTIKNPHGFSSGKTTVTIDGETVGTVNGDSVTTSTSTLTNGKHKVVLRSVGPDGKITVFSETVDVKNPFFRQVLADYINRPVLSASLTLVAAVLIVLTYTFGWVHWSLMKVIAAVRVPYYKYKTRDYVGVSQARPPEQIISPDQSNKIDKAG